jgi:hypothetical protein
MAMGLPPVTSAVFLVAIHFGKIGYVGGISEMSLLPLSGIKVCKFTD